MTNFALSTMQNRHSYCSENPSAFYVRAERWQRSRHDFQVADLYSRCALRLGSPDDDRSTGYGRSKTHRDWGEILPRRFRV